MTAKAQVTNMNMSVLDAEVATRGIDADPVTLLLLAHAARDLGFDEVLIDVMVDEAEPEVARIRAYSRVSSAVSMRLSRELADPSKVLQAA
ncbi:MAG: hypothetical protein GC156_16145 [Actinomycetales bacterium]|nr:hypothetical protein [Actinomycetales bacterium]